MRSSLHRPRERVRRHNFELSGQRRATHGHRFDKTTEKRAMGEARGVYKLVGQRQQEQEQKPRALLGGGRWHVSCHNSRWEGVVPKEIRVGFYRLDDTDAARSCRWIGAL